MTLYKSDSGSAPDYPGGAVAGGGFPDPTPAGEHFAPGHLPARRAPNDGAHRLAWWLARRGDAGVSLLERVYIEPAAIDRMIDGTVVPENGDAIALARATDGAVQRVDFNTVPGAAWDAAPRPRPPAPGWIDM